MDRRGGGDGADGEETVRAPGETRGASSIERPGSSVVKERGQIAPFLVAEGVWPPEGGRHVPEDGTMAGGYRSLLYNKCNIRKYSCQENFDKNLSG